MTEPNSPARHPFEPRETDLAATNHPPPSDMERFLGGKPSSVAVRLAFLSLIVGFFLVWLDIKPMDVLLGLRGIVQHFWAMGFDAIRGVAEYVVAGAAIVIPIWLVLRLLDMRGRN